MSRGSCRGAQSGSPAPLKSINSAEKSPIPLGSHGSRPLRGVGRDRLVAFLVDNASCYPDTHRRVFITVGVDDGRIVLAVDHTGPAIPLKDRAKLFDRFHGATDEGTGAGLGLAIADSVVQSTGGRW
jgi:Histidine kinase-, DNA gyrase B-, and HSP90-like ATPase